MAAARSTLSASARRALHKLSQGESIRLGKADRAALQAADLIAAGDGSPCLTDAGRAYLARLQAEGRQSAIGAFREQHLSVARPPAGGDRSEGVGADALVDESESPLLWLARRKGRDGRALIEPLQLMAGERLRETVTRAQMLPRMTASWDPNAALGRGAEAMNPTDAIIAARQQVRHALDAVGSDLSGLLLDVCCFLKRLDDVERERGWPPRSAKVVLQLGLDRLARHYGYAVAARGPDHAALRVWIGDDAA